jgi:hypothetical protein
LALILIRFSVNAILLEVTANLFKRIMKKKRVANSVTTPAMVEIVKAYIDTPAPPRNTNNLKEIISDSSSVLPATFHSAP